MTMNRRDFLKNAALAATGVAIGATRQDRIAAANETATAPQEKTASRDSVEKWIPPLNENGNMLVENAMTADFLRSAFGGESMAHMRYLLWGEHAAMNGFPNIARLYKAIAYAERVHAGNHFLALADNTGGFNVDAGAEFGFKDVAQNLVWAIEGERAEVEQMYPAYRNVAEMQGENAAAISFHYALEAEKVHIQLFTEARELALKGEDMTLKDDSVYVCPICGFTHVGDHEDPCPVCLAESETFVRY